MRICILGGGLAGFSTAAILSKYASFCNYELDIEVIHNPSIKAITAGESTQIQINLLFDYLGLFDNDWMKECDATYKAGVRFQDFNYGTHFFYPFFSDSFAATEDEKKANVRTWFAAREEHRFTPDLSANYFQPNGTKYLDHNRLAANLQTAYHFNASKLGNFLKRYAEAKGVVVHEATYKDAITDAQGNIRALLCDDQSHHADYFIDCTGFNSLLLNKVPNKWIPFDKTLINNRVIRASIEYKNKSNELKNYTNSTAFKHGWCWDIPLWTHRSVGYVHTTQFTTEDEIEQEFRDHFGDVETDVLTFKSGRFEKSFVNNVIGVGTSCGFTEPLEATNISAIVQNIFTLTEFLNKRNGTITTVDKDMFNHKVSEGFDTWRTFIECHYIFALRSDSDYWNHISHGINWDYQSTSSFNYREILQTVTKRTFRGCEDLLGPLHIAAGQGYSPLASDFLNHPDIKKTSFDKQRFLNDLDFNRQEMDEQLSSYLFLKETIYK